MQTYALVPNMKPCHTPSLIPKAVNCQKKRKTKLFSHPQYALSYCTLAPSPPNDTKFITKYRPLPSCEIWKCHSPLNSKVTGLWGERILHVRQGKRSNSWKHLYCTADAIWMVGYLWSHKISHGNIETGQNSWLRSKTAIGCQIFVAPMVKEWTRSSHIHTQISTVLSQYNTDDLSYWIKISSLQHALCIFNCKLKLIHYPSFYIAVTLRSGFD